MMEAQSAQEISERFPLGEENGGILRLNVGTDENWSGREDANPLFRPYVRP